MVDQDWNYGRPRLKLWSTPRKECWSTSGTASRRPMQKNPSDGHFPMERKQAVNTVWLNSPFSSPIKLQHFRAVVGLAIHPAHLCSASKIYTNQLMAIKRIHSVSTNLYGFRASQAHSSGTANEMFVRFCTQSDVFLSYLMRTGTQTVPAFKELYKLICCWRRCLSQNAHYLSLSPSLSHKLRLITIMHDEYLLVHAMFTQCQR